MARIKASCWPQALPTSAASASTWDFSLASTGEDVFWVSPTNVNPAAPAYDASYEITSVVATISVFGAPVDVEAIDEPFPIRLGRGLFALIVMIVLLWAFSANRSAIRWSLVAKGLGLQLLFALLVLKTNWGRGFFRVVNDVFVALLSYTNAGASFVFGNLVKPVVPVSGGEGSVPLLANFAFSVLPTIIFFSALMTILYYLGLMQRVVKGVAWLMQPHCYSKVKYSLV